MTADGKISTRAGTASGFTSSRDKHRLLEIRAKVDAVMVGHGTAEIDNMSMLIPDEALRQSRVAAGKAENPVRVLISNGGAISPSLRVLQTAGAMTVIYSSERMPEDIRTELEKRAEVHLLGEEKLNLAAALEHLRKVYKVRSLVCEGGPTLMKSLLEEDLVDEMYATIAPRLFGGKEAPGMTGKPGDFLPASREFRLKEFFVENDECYTHYVRHGRVRR